MVHPTRDAERLIPPPDLVRAELARSVREARRLRSLLRLSVREEQDRRFVLDLISLYRQAADGRGVNR